MDDKTERIGKSVIGRFIERTTETLTPRELRVLTLRLGSADDDKLSLGEIGAIFGVTRERIRQIEAKSLRKISELYIESEVPAGSDTTPDRLTYLEASAQLLGETVAALSGVATSLQVSERLGCTEEELILCVQIIQKCQRLTSPVPHLSHPLVFTWHLDPINNLFMDRDHRSTSDLLAELLPKNMIMRADQLIDKVSQHVSGFDSEILQTYIDHEFIFELTGDADNINPERIYLYKTLTKPVREISRALITGSEKYYSVHEVDQGIHLVKGLRCDLITEWLESRSDYHTSSRALNSLCRRQDEIFAETSTETWGLKVAGAIQGIIGQERQPIRGLIVAAIEKLVEMNTWRIENFKISKKSIQSHLSGHYSAGWIGQNIDSMLKDGYLENLTSCPQYNLRPNLRIPLSEQVLTIDNLSAKVGHGSVVRFVIEALTETPSGLNEEEVIRHCKKKDSLIKADTVSIYLRTHLTDLIEKSTENTFTLIQQPPLVGAHADDQRKTIQILVAVMATAEEPLRAEEIYERCRGLGHVRKNAVSGYLSQNYGNLFKKTPNDKYQLR